MRFLYPLMLTSLLVACASQPPGPTEDEKLFASVSAVAATGDVAAERQLGEMYMDGQGTKPDPGKAVQWLTKAADAGDAEAQVNLGWAYQRGDGVSKDGVKAQQLFLKAAQQDFPPGENAAGYGYLAGLGTPVDHAQALTWLMKASAAGNSSADANLAEMYRRGDGVPQDTATRLKYLKQSAERGNRRIQMYLARAYRDGSDGFTRDIGESQKYFDMATDMPVHTYQELRDAVYLIVDGHKRYPKEAFDRHESGVVRMAFLVDHRRVMEYRIVQSSGSSSLDEAMKADLADCYFPPLDPSLDSKRWFTISITFEMPGSQPAPAAATR